MAGKPTLPRFWIFDMDGTLTEAVHDFDAIRAELGLPQGQPILEAIAQCPAAEQARLHARLYDIEREFATQSIVQPGADQLLNALNELGCRFGIVTRNSWSIALETLTHCGLARWFARRDIKGREHGIPKPDPDALLQLMLDWGATAEHTIMVGDFSHDLAAGRAAGVRTAQLDVKGQHRWPELSDHTLRSLDELLGCFEVE